MPHIALEKVTKSFGNGPQTKTVLDELSFSISTDQRLGVLGRNGAGKSTLLKAIAGSTHINAGRIVRNGSVSWPLGFSGAFHPHLTGRQNMSFVARIYQRSESDLIDYVEDFSELGKDFDIEFRKYSSGMKARLAFGASMGISFDFYLVDEITAVGDQAFQKKSRATFETQFSRSGMVMVSHSHSTIKDYCNSCLVLENGHGVMFDDMDEAFVYYDEVFRKKVG